MLYIHEVDGVSSIKIPAVLFGIHTLEEKKRRVITHNSREQQHHHREAQPEGLISCSGPQMPRSA